MSAVIVPTELAVDPPKERFGRSSSLPLQEQLVETGLGRVLDFESLRRTTAELGHCPAEEAAVELVNEGYGRELVAAILSDAGIMPRTFYPLRWAEYPTCKKYTPRAGPNTAISMNSRSRT